MANFISYEAIIEAHKSVCDEERALEAEIKQMLENDAKFTEEMKKISEKIPILETLPVDCKQLSENIHSTSNRASDVSFKIKQLDSVKTRVSQCLQRVGDILDLKYCTQNIEEALNNEDYEVAAANIHRFLSIDESAIRNSTNGTINGQVLGGSSLEEAFVKLHEAEDKLKTLVTRKFDEAVRESDSASVERFFKIFPLLKQKDNGLRKFSNYLCLQMNPMDTINSSGGFAGGDSVVSDHIGQLTNLFESIAKMIDAHTPLFETYYGPGNLIYCVEVLQRECDLQSKKILEDFVDKRNLNSTVSSINKSSKISSTGNSVNKVDPREIVAILNDLMKVNSRSETYFKFIRERTKKDINSSVNEDDERLTVEEKLKKVDDLIRNCSLSRMIQELNGAYVLLEEYFARESCLKAIQADDIETSATPTLTQGSLTSSMLDDIFFIVKQSITRALTSGNLDVLCATLNNTVSILESSFCDSFSERVKHGFPNIGSISGALGSLDLSQAYNAIQTGRYLQTVGDIEKAKVIFLCSLNNLDTACDYIRSLKTTVKDQVVKSSIIVDEPVQKEKLESCLNDLFGLIAKFQSLINSGCHQIFASLVKGRIKSWLDSFNSESHLLSDDDIVRFEITDGLRPYTQTFMVNLDSILKSMKSALTSNNYKTLINILSTELSQRLENAALKCTFNKVIIIFNLNLLIANLYFNFSFLSFSLSINCSSVVINSIVK